MKLYLAVSAAVRCLWCVISASKLGLVEVSGFTPIAPIIVTGNAFQLL